MMRAIDKNTEIYKIKLCKASFGENVELSKILNLEEIQGQNYFDENRIRVNMDGYIPYNNGIIKMKLKNNDSFIKYIKKVAIFGESLYRPYRPVIFKNSERDTSNINVYITIYHMLSLYTTTYVIKQNEKYIMLVNGQPIVCVEDMSQLANVIGKTGHFGVVVRKVNFNDVKELNEAFEALKCQKDYFSSELYYFGEQSQTHVHPEISNALRMIMNESSIKQKKKSNNIINDRSKILQKIKKI